MADLEAGSLGEDVCAGSQLESIVPSIGHGLLSEAFSLGLLRSLELWPL